MSIRATLAVLSALLLLVGTAGGTGTYSGPAGGAEQESYLVGGVSNTDSFRTSTSLRRPESCNWDMAAESFICVTDNSAILEEFTRSGSQTSSIDTMLRSDIATWINGDADRNLDLFHVDQMTLEWEVSAIHPVTGDLWVVNNVNDTGGAGDCDDAASGVDPQDVAHLFQLIRGGGDLWEVQDVWRMPSANEDDGGQCTGGLNVYPVFEINPQAMFIDNSGTFFVGNGLGFFELDVPAAATGTNLATLGSQVIDINADSGVGATNPGRADFDQVGNRAFIVVYDAPNIFDDSVCNATDPPCRVDLYVYDWSVRKLESIISVGGYDRFASSDGTAAQSPSFERPRSFVFMETGEKAGDGYWFSDEDGNSGSVHPNAAWIVMEDKAFTLGGFTKTFTFNAPAADDEFIWYLGGAVDINSYTCQVTMPAAATSGEVTIEVERTEPNGSGAVGTFSPSSAVCAKPLNAGGNGANSEISANQSIRVSVETVTGTVDVLEVILHMERVSSPR